MSQQNTAIRVTHEHFVMHTPIGPMFKDPSNNQLCILRFDADIEQLVWEYIPDFD